MKSARTNAVIVIITAEHNDEFALSTYIRNGTATLGKGIRRVIRLPIVIKNPLTTWLHILQIYIAFHTPLKNA